MRQSNIKRFAVLFAVFLLLQDTHGRLTFKLDKNAYQRNEKEIEVKDAIETEANRDQEKSR